MKIKTNYKSALHYLCYDSRRTWEIKKELMLSLKEQNCTLSGAPLPIALMPILLTDKELLQMTSIAEMTSKLIEKTVEACFSSPRMKDYLSIDIIPPEWLQKKHLKTPILVTRIDMVYNGKDFKVIGVECDAPRGQAWTELCRTIFASHPFYKKLIIEPERELEKKFLSSFTSNIQQIQKKIADGNSNVALVDYKESLFITDLQIISRFLTNSSIKAFIADPRDFVYRNGKAYVNESPVDVVIRGLKTKDMLREVTKLDNFIQAYNNDAFYMVNPLHSVYGSEKSILSLMTNNDFSDIYSPAEKQFLEKHICWTRCLSEQKTQYRKQPVELKEFVKQHRENLVIKPISGDTHQVHVGVAMEQPRWDGIVNNYIGRSDWVVQEYLNLPSVLQPKLIKGKVNIQKCYFSFSAFTTKNQFQTLLARCSPHHAINLEKEGMVVPIFKYEKQKHIPERYLK